MNKLALIISKISSSIFIILFSFFNILFTFYKANGETTLANHFNLTTMILSIILLIFLYFIYKSEISNRKLFMIFIVFVTLFGVYWIFSNDYNIINYDDSYNCYHAAKDILKHDLTGISYKSYINMYPHNLPLVSLFVVLYKIFGELTLYVYRLANLILVVLAYMTLVKLVDSYYSNSNINRIAIILLYGLTQFVFLAYIPYTVVISFSLSIISIYYFTLFLKEHKYGNLVISLSIICLSTIFKSNSLIILVAMLIFLIIDLINNKSAKSILTFFAFFISTTIITNSIIGFWSYKSDTNYDNKMPTIVWIALGLNQDPNNPGGYFDSLYNYHHSHDFVVEYTTIEAKRQIQYFIDLWEGKPLNAIKFYINKFSGAYNSPIFNSYTFYKIDPHLSINNDIRDGTIGELFFYKWDATMSIFSLGLLIFLFKNLKKATLAEMFAGVIAFGGFAFHMIWEANSIYTYIYILILLPYACNGLYELITQEHNHYSHIPS